MPYAKHHQFYSKMTVHLFEVHPAQNLSGITKTNVVLASLITLISLPMIYLFLINTSYIPWLASINNAETNTCNIFRGKWVPYPHDPYYSNATCRQMHDQQNCMKFGRPDKEFLHWRWKPEKCELPLFDAEHFLELLRGKSMAFVGDSLGRNQMESLWCLLASVVDPSFVSQESDLKIKHWLFKDYNFTLVYFWSPHLVKAVDADPNGPTYNRLMNLYLDKADDTWAAKIKTFDYVIISAARWFYGPQIYYENEKVIGCHECNRNNIKNVTMFYGYRRVFRTSLRTLLSLEGFKGVTILRTLSPAHFENGEWNKGGNCARTRPVSKKVMKLDGGDLKLYLTQLQELRAAEREGRKKGLKFRFLDATAAMVLRPDGHPNHFGHWPHENVTIADCVHWCLPGPVDTWNEFLLQMLRMYGDS